MRSVAVTRLVAFTGIALGVAGCVAMAGCVAYAPEGRYRDRGPDYVVVHDHPAPPPREYREYREPEERPLVGIHVD